MVIDMSSGRAYMYRSPFGSKGQLANPVACVISQMNQLISV